EGVLMSRPALAAFAAAAALALGADAGLRGAYEPRFPPLSELEPGPYALQDAAGNAPPDLADPPGDPYGRLKSLCLRVGRLDPSFRRAFLYGAGVLGWFQGVERPADAVDVLKEGMRRDPGEPLFPLYLAALAYKQKGRTGDMISLLESSFDAPQTPTTMKTILANLHK